MKMRSEGLRCCLKQFLGIHTVDDSISQISYHRCITIYTWTFYVFDATSKPRVHPPIRLCCKLVSHNKDNRWTTVILSYTQHVQHGAIACIHHLTEDHNGRTGFAHLKVCLSSKSSAVVPSYTDHIERLRVSSKV